MDRSDSWVYSPVGDKNNEEQNKNLYVVARYEFDLKHSLRFTKACEENSARRVY